MAQRIIDKIRNEVKSGNYDMTHHPTEEMAEDELGIYDIECAILKGKIIKKETDDPRGVKFVIKGVGVDISTSIGIVGRFKETGVFLIITVYKIT